MQIDINASDIHYRHHHHHHEYVLLATTAQMRSQMDITETLCTLYSTHLTCVLHLVFFSKSVQNT